MTMTDINSIAEQLKSLSATELQKILLATSNVDGSEVKRKRIARTEKYFKHAPKPHQCLTFDVYSKTVDYIHELGVDRWLAERGSL